MFTSSLQISRPRTLIWTGEGYSHPESTTRLTNDGLMLGQRRRRWPNIKPALVKRVVIAGQYNPDYIKHWSNSDRMLGQCLRCWPTIELTLCDGVVLTVSCPYVGPLPIMISHSEIQTIITLAKCCFNFGPELTTFA